MKIRLGALTVALAAIFVSILAWRLSERSEAITLSRSPRAMTSPVASSLEGETPGGERIEAKGEEGGSIMLSLPERPIEVAPGKVVMSNETVVVIHCRSGNRPQWYPDVRAEVLARPMRLWEIVTLGTQQFEERIHFLREKCASRFNDNAAEFFSNSTGKGVLRSSVADGHTIVYCEESGGQYHEVLVSVVGAKDGGADIAWCITAGLTVVSSGPRD